MSIHARKKNRLFLQGLRWPSLVIPVFRAREPQLRILIYGVAAPLSFGIALLAVNGPPLSMEPVAPALGALLLDLLCLALLTGSIGGLAVGLCTWLLARTCGISNLGARKNMAICVWAFWQTLAYTLGVSMLAGLFKIEPAWIVVFLAGSLSGLIAHAWLKAAVCRKENIITLAVFFGLLALGAKLLSA